MFNSCTSLTAGNRKRFRWFPTEPIKGVASCDQRLQTGHYKRGVKSLNEVSCNPGLRLVVGRLSIGSAVLDQGRNHYSATIRFFRGFSDLTAILLDV